MKLLETNVSRRSLLAGFGATAVGIITLTACGSGSGSASSGAKDFVMTVWGGEIDKAAYQARHRPAGQGKFPDCNITLQLIPNDGYAQKVQTMIAGGTGPDIMQVAENVNVYSQQEPAAAARRATSRRPGSTSTQRFGAVGELYSYEDKVYAIPDRSGAMILYYNKALFEAKGIKAPDRGLDLGRRRSAPPRS